MTDHKAAVASARRMYLHYSGYRDPHMEKDWGRTVAAMERMSDALDDATDLGARISQLEADNAALMAAVRAAVDYDPGLWAYTPFVDALPAHLKDEASK